MNVFVKISGDLIDNTKVHTWICELSLTCRVTICVGGGKQINEAFSRKGYPVTEHGPLGRETKTPGESGLAKKILEKNLQYINKVLCSKINNCNALIPFLHVDGVGCHINGDTMALVSYIGFDKLYILTTADRVSKKQSEFGHLPKIEIVGF